MPPRAPARSFALMRFPNRLLVPLVLIAPALLPAVAAAGAEVTYGVKYSGAGTYHQAGRHTFDLAFSLPRDILGMGYIEQLVGPKRLTGADCPGFLEGETTDCVMEWSGKVELRKLSERTTGAPAPAPVPTKKRFTLAAAPGARTTKLKLPAKARKALKKAKKAKLKITFTEPQRSVKTLTVKLPRR